MISWRLEIVASYASPEKAFNPQKVAFFRCSRLTESPHWQGRSSFTWRIAAAAEIDGPCWRIRYITYVWRKWQWCLDMNFYCKSKQSQDIKTNYFRDKNTHTKIKNKNPSKAICLMIQYHPTHIHLFILLFPESIHQLHSFLFHKKNVRNLWKRTNPLMRTPPPCPKLPQCRVLRRGPPSGQGGSKEGLTRRTRPKSQDTVLGGCRAREDELWKASQQKSGAKWNTETETKDF